MMSFEGSSPWSLAILCDQSIGVDNIVAYTYEFTVYNALNYFLDSKSYYRARKSPTIILNVFLL
jgi:hypothetical protein